jgi:hypothetical protein
MAFILPSRNKILHTYTHKRILNGIYSIKSVRSLTEIVHVAQKIIRTVCLSVSLSLSSLSLQ